MPLLLFFLQRAGSVTPLLSIHNPDSSSTLFKFQAETEGRSRKRTEKPHREEGVGRGERARHLLGTYYLPSSKLDT